MVEDFEDKQAKQDEFYASLKEKLTENHNFPEDYLFKFIIPNDSEKVTEIMKIFDGTKNTISNRESKNAKYTSLTLNVFVLDADQVISFYKKAAEIDGVIML